MASFMDQHYTQALADYFNEAGYTYNGISSWDATSVESEIQKAGLSVQEHFQKYGNNSQIVAKLFAQSGFEGGYLKGLAAYLNDANYSAYGVDAGYWTATDVKSGIQDSDMSVSDHFQKYGTRSAIISQVNQANEEEGATSGVVVDGYVSGATVFADQDGDGEQDPGEPTTTTDEQGEFDFGQDVDGQIISTGGTDITTGLKVEGSLNAPEGSEVISPLTTLVSQVQKQIGQSAEQAESQIRNSLGIPDDVDLNNYDPVSVISDEGASQEDQQTAVQVQAALTQVANTVSQAGSAASGATGQDQGESNNQARNALASAISQAGEGNKVDLSDTDTVKNIVSESLSKALEATGTEVDENQAQDIADNVAEIAGNANKQVKDSAAQGGDPFDAMHDIVKTQKVIQGECCDSVRESASSGDFTETVNQYTGDDFDIVVEEAEVNVAFPTEEEGEEEVGEDGTGGGGGAGSGSGSDSLPEAYSVKTYTEFKDALNDHENRLDAGDTLVINVTDDIGPTGFEDNGELIYTGDHDLDISGDHTLNANNFSHILEFNAPGHDLTIEGLAFKGGDYGEGLPGGAVWAHGANVDVSGATFDSNATDEVIRGDDSVDVLQGGNGDDFFVVVGDLRGENKSDSQENTRLLGEQITDMLGNDYNEDADGSSETIDGGPGENTLYVYGEADLSNYSITNIQSLEIHSDVSMSADQFEIFERINGDGRSTIRIVNKGTSPSTVNLSDELSENKLQNLGMIEVGKDVKLEINSADVFGGARVLVGEGKVQGSGEFSLPETFAVESTLDIRDAAGSNARGNAEVLDRVISGKYGEVISNTNGNDYIVGTEGADTFELSGGGNDVVSARNGDDTFIISGPGTKKLLSTEGTETVDLSQATAAADFDLTYGGQLGTDLTDVQLGTGGGSSGTYQEAPKHNVMLVIDVSGSMQGQHISDVKQAANDLFDEYQRIGDEIAVRIVTFSSNADSSFNGKDAWMDIDAARSVVNDLKAYGGTNYREAINKAMVAFDHGKGETYIKGGANASYFLSDGLPNSGDYVSNIQQDTWEEFLINNQITSNSIGFAGIKNTGPLEPISFNGTKLSDPSEDHSSAQIDPLIEYDSIALAETIVEQAKLDYIENLNGTDYNDVLAGNSLDNKIYGNDGDDTIKGLGGDDILSGGKGFDSAVFRDDMENYNINSISEGWLVEHKTNGEDGKKIIDNTLEQLVFNDACLLTELIKPSKPSDYELLNKYAPALALTEDEEYFPISIEAFLEHSVLFSNNQPAAFGSNVETARTQNVDFGKNNYSNKLKLNNAGSIANCLDPAIHHKDVI